MARTNERIAITVEWPQLTNEDLDGFGKLLESCREEKVIKVGGEEKKIRPINLDEAMLRFGAVKKSFPYNSEKIPVYSVIMTPTETDDFGNVKRWAKPSRFDIFQYTYDKWRKREWAKNKQDEAYQQAAVVEPEPEYEVQ